VKDLSQDIRLFTALYQAREKNSPEFPRDVFLREEREEERGRETPELERRRKKESKERRSASEGMRGGRVGSRDFSCGERSYEGGRSRDTSEEDKGRPKRGSSREVVKKISRESAKRMQLQQLVEEGEGEEWEEEGTQSASRKSSPSSFANVDGFFEVSVDICEKKDLERYFRKFLCLQLPNSLKFSNFFEFFETCSDIFSVRNVSHYRILSRKPQHQTAILSVCTPSPPLASFGLLPPPSASFSLLRPPSSSLSLLQPPSTSLSLLRPPSFFVQPPLASSLLLFWPSHSFRPASPSSILLLPPSSSFKYSNLPRTSNSCLLLVPQRGSLAHSGKPVPGCQALGGTREGMSRIAEGEDRESMEEGGERTKEEEEGGRREKEEEGGRRVNRNLTPFRLIRGKGGKGGEGGEEEHW
jgi:hypothetical protein